MTGVNTNTISKFNILICFSKCIDGNSRRAMLGTHNYLITK